MHTIFAHEVPAGKTINGEYYKEYIQKYPAPTIRKKRPELLAERLSLLHDYATPHRTGGVTSLIESYNWEFSDHPPYAPDTIPCDYDLFLFPELNENMRGMSDLEVLEVAVQRKFGYMNVVA